jgi:hypothetical protein
MTPLAGARVDVDVVHAHPGPPEEAQAPRMGEELDVHGGGRARDDGLAVRDLPEELLAGQLGRNLLHLETALDEMGDTFRRDGVDDHDLHEFMLSRSTCVLVAETLVAMPGAAAPAGGLPPWTTLNRDARGHSWPATRLWFLASRISAEDTGPGREAPTDTTAPARLPLGHERSDPHHRL